MNNNNRPEEILKDIKKMNFKVDTFFNEVKNHIQQTKMEVEKRKKAKR
ncbi:hypothetical protein J2X07_003732 [Fictibacillus barbaricus]|uniref:Uncharacterized protein n=1 Tax=Fictibacillus barbaricus TaxID=182136 RepID=A0ABU1U5J5_9BACL|nr:hypothetical protein [Fictibacillus barbaricus]